MAGGGWSDWDVIRRQVALCGRVLGQPAPSDTVEVRAEGPGVDKTVFPRHDGIYYFLDLPPGDYRVTATNARGEVINGGVGHVARTAAGDVLEAVVDVDPGATRAEAAPAPRQPRRKRAQ